MPPLTIKISGKLRATVERRAAEGDYPDPAEYVRDLVRRDEERRKRRELEELLLKRLDRSAAVEMDAADFKRIRRRFLSRAARAKRA
jgi:Arc/MetJ-type ribon-helix-helix transcriptional regulator